MNFVLSGAHALLCEIGSFTIVNMELHATFYGRVPKPAQVYGLTIPFRRFLFVVHALFIKCTWF